MQRMKLADDLFPAIKEGRKRGTIRLGRRDVRLGALLLESPNDSGPTTIVDVGMVSYLRACDLSNEDARADGYNSVSDLLDDLKRFYPSLVGSDEVTVVRFSA